MKRLIIIIATSILLFSCSKRNFMPETVPGGRPPRPIPDTTKKDLNTPIKIRT